MEFSFSSFILDNLEAAGAIGGYVSLSIIGFALISFDLSGDNFNQTSRLDLNGHILLLDLFWEQFLDVGQQL